VRSARRTFSIQHGHLYARMHPLDDKLFAAMAGLVEHRVSEFIRQDYANTAGAFARTHQLNEKPLAAMARLAE